MSHFWIMISQISDVPRLRSRRTEVYSNNNNNSNNDNHKNHNNNNNNNDNYNDNKKTLIVLIIMIVITILMNLHFWNLWISLIRSQFCMYLNTNDNNYNTAKIKTISYQAYLDSLGPPLISMLALILDFKLL